MNNLLSTPSPFDDAAMLAYVSFGDEMAFQKLFQRHRVKVFHFCWKLTKSSAAAEEIVVDIFAKLWTGRAICDQIACPEAFLQKAAWHKSVGYLRGVSRQDGLKNVYLQRLSQVPERRGDDILTDARVRHLLYKAVSSSPLRRKLVDPLSRQRDLSQEQIAAALNLFSKNQYHMDPCENRFACILRRFIDDTMTSDELDELWTLLDTMETDGEAKDFSDLWKDLGEEKLLPAYWDAMLDKARDRAVRWDQPRSRLPSGLRIAGLAAAACLLILAGICLVRLQDKQPKAMPSRSHQPSAPTRLKKSMASVAPALTPFRADGRHYAL